MSEIVGTRHDTSLPIEARGNLWLELVYDLAAKEVNYNYLCSKYQVKKTALQDFEKKYSREIINARERVTDEYAALWITDKSSRLAEAQKDVEFLNDQIEVGEKPMEAIRQKTQILRNVADELGHLPGRAPTIVQHTTVNYHVEGVDMSKLQVAEKPMKKVIEGDVVDGD